MKTIKIIITSMVVCLLAQANCSSAGTVSPGYQSTDRISVGLLMAYSYERRMAITESRVESPFDDETQDIQITNGLHNDDRYGNYSIGMNAWFPLFKYNHVDINGVVYIDHISGDNVTATGHEDINLDDDDVVAKVQFKSHRTNFGVGFNLVKDFSNSAFVEVMFAGGVTRFHARGEFYATQLRENGELNALQVTNHGDHPGVISTNPFISVEFGVGKHLSAQSKAYLFVNYTAARRDDPFLLSTVSEDQSHAMLHIPKKWLKVGLAITRDINI